jgi:hypothetical protein
MRLRIARLRPKTSQLQGHVCNVLTVQLRLKCSSRLSLLVLVEPLATTMRRYTRLSNGFSRKMENHAAATALNYFAHNFIKIHRTLRTSPAMAVGVTDLLWSVEPVQVTHSIPVLG